MVKDFGQETEAVCVYASALSLHLYGQLCVLEQSKDTLKLFHMYEIQRCLVK